MKWPGNIKEAKKIQHALKQKVKIIPLIKEPGFIAGVDDLKSSIDIVLKCIVKYRIPEPLRRADYLSRKIKKELLVIILCDTQR